MTIWSNFLGYTGMPQRTFSFEEASMSAEELAVASLAVPPNEANAKGSSLYPQGSMFNLGYRYERDIEYIDDEGNWQRKDNCPSQNASDAFCPNINQCVGTWNPAPTNSPSTNQMFGYLVVLAVVYTLLAAYWAIVLPGAVRIVALWIHFDSMRHWFQDSSFCRCPFYRTEWCSTKVLLLSSYKLLVWRM